MFPIDEDFSGRGLAPVVLALRGGPHPRCAQDQLDGEPDYESPENIHGVISSSRLTLSSGDGALSSQPLYELTHAPAMGSNPAAFLAAKLQVSAVPGGMLRLMGTGRSGHTYEIQASADFAAWAIVGTELAGEEGAFNGARGLSGGPKTRSGWPAVRATPLRRRAESLEGQPQAKTEQAVI